MRLKSLISILTGIVLLIAAGYGSYKWLDTQLSTSNNSQSVEEDHPPIALAEEQGGDTIEVVLKKRPDEALEELFPFNMSEYEMQEVIHYMSHGLVEADEKWGKIELTEERIERLLQVAEKNKSTYQKSDVYISILMRWKEGNFSNAVEDHNSIWRMWDGTVGKATRLLTASEIKEYNDTHFD